MMETLIPEISRLLSDSLSSQKTLVVSATNGLDRLSSDPSFPLALLAVIQVDESQWLRLAAAARLKNFTRQYMEGMPASELHCEFRNQLAQASLQAEHAVLKLLLEAFCIIITDDFVKKNVWPELIPELNSVIWSSNLINTNGHSQWKTINALTVLQMIIRPFQYFLNPKVLKEPVPVQLELIAERILVPLQVTFHHYVDKVVLSFQGKIQVESEQVLLVICKCMYFAVRSYMPSALSVILPSFCQDLFWVLDSLNLCGASPEDGYVLRLKTAKRSLYIFRALVTRHQKQIDKLMPNIFSCTFRISKQSANVSKLDFLSERIVSLAFDVIAHLLETGLGWRLVSPHFSSLLDSAIFPALSMNLKDISEWEADTDEYIRKNLPLHLEEISVSAEDLFTARKSAMNLLGVLAMSKGPPVACVSSKRKKGDKSKGREQRSSIGELVVVPFLSKFPIPPNANEANAPRKILHDYFGVLMAYGGLQVFLKEKKPEYTSSLVRNRVLPLYSLSTCSPYLVATANWVLGELAPCLPQEMAADIYSSLLKALSMSDVQDINCYPVRASAAGAIATLLENDYVPSDWLSLMQVLVEKMDTTDENDSMLSFQLLGSVVDAGQDKAAIHIPYVVSRLANAISKHLPPTLDPWPRVVESGFAVLAAMLHTWDDSADEVRQHDNSRWTSGCTSIARNISYLLQQVWLKQVQEMEGTTASRLSPPSCINDASALIGCIMRFTTTIDEAMELNLPELLAVWAQLIAEWRAWEEMEDLAIFSSIREAIDWHRRCDFTCYFLRRFPPQSLSYRSASSIIEGIAAFICEAINAYASATWRACSCVHVLLHTPRFSSKTEDVKCLMAVMFAEAAFSHFLCIREKSLGLWKPLLLAIASCYICYPDNIEQVLEKNRVDGFTNWACCMARLSGSTFEPGLTAESEIKIAVLSLAKVVERLVGATPLDGSSVVLRECFSSLMEACIHFKEVQEVIGDDTETVDEEASDEEIDDENDEDIDEDSEDSEREETEEEFLNRYAKAAEALEGEIIEEGDSEDEVHELELGDLDEVDVQQTVVALIDRNRQVLAGPNILQPMLIRRVLDAFPRYSLFFPASF